MTTGAAFAKVFANGPLSRADAVSKLVELAGVGKSTAYRALDEKRLAPVIKASGAKVD